MPAFRGRDFKLGHYRICGLLWLVLGFLGIALVFWCCLLAFRAENAIFLTAKAW